MESETIALVILILGVILIVAEAMSPGAFMVIPGTVLIVLGIAGYIYPDFLMSIYSPIIAFLLAVPVTLVTIKGYQLLAKPAPPTTTISESLVGKIGELTVASGPGNLKGKVRIGSDTWSSTSDVNLEKGMCVRVVSAEGVHVKVEKVEDDYSV